MTINQAYLIPDDGGQALPFLMASDYQPRTLQDKLNLVITKEVVEVLPEEIQIKLAVMDQSIVLGGETKEAYDLSHCEWVILTKPAGYYVYDKSIDRIRKQVRGEDWSSNLSTVARVFLACAVNGEVLMDGQGNIQIFTLKLSGTRCNWIYKGDRSMIGLNKALCKKYGVPSGNWLTHLVSVGISPVPYATEYEGQKNIRTRFEFSSGRGAKPLADIYQAACFALVLSDDFKTLMSDPFGVERATTAPPKETSTEIVHTKAATVSEDEWNDIPF